MPLTAAIARWPVAATLSQAARPLTSGSALLTVPLHSRVNITAGTIAKSDRMTMRRVRNRSCFIESVLTGFSALSAESMTLGDGCGGSGG